MQLLKPVALPGLRNRRVRSSMTKLRSPQEFGFVRPGKFLVSFSGVCSFDFGYMAVC